MRTAGGPRRAGSGSAGVLLRGWRDLRGVSQLDLAFDTGISQKHVSFVESGRSRPSPQMVIDLSDALNVPLRERNAILVAAGHAPRYSEVALDEPSLSRVTSALKRMLRQNEPFPAMVLDRHWNVILANDAAPRFFGCFVDLGAWPSPRNLLHLVFDPAALRPFVVDWAPTSRMLLARVYREAPGHALDARTRQLLEELERYPGVDLRRRATEPDAALPLIPLTFAKDGASLSYFSLITTVGAPQAVAAEELRLECMLPADDETERLHPGFVARHAPRHGIVPP